FIGLLISAGKAIHDLIRRRH
uniref:Chrysophsin-3 n=1 Tax=Pagrus major TaxID=143350 RepID=CHY3_PAGMA|nr:RecName: Full=Chrysophsin-3 [Pagrus major]